MVLFLHNRYRTTGGEERVVDDLLALVRERLGEPAELLQRDSAALGKLSAATGLLRGGIAPREVAKAVRLTGARVVHAHNLNPVFGWRALAAAREEGARVVLHLHQYRLVCATGVVLHRRTGVHPLPRPQHVAWGDAQLSWQPRRGIGVWGFACAVAAASPRPGRRVHGAERVRARAPARAGSAA